jgi:hypothetical protein
MLPEHQAIRVAQHMCDVTRDILWAHSKDWALKKSPHLKISFEIGTGKKTYCRSPAQSTKPIGWAIIRYGRVMVAEKYHPALSRGWLSTRELIGRNYYEGEVTPLNLLSHVVVHEYGHFTQILLGRRYDGAVHNTEFYEILDRIHRNGHAERVKTELSRRLSGENIPLNFIVLPHMEGREYFNSMDEISVGVKVGFERRGKIYAGRVIKKNRRTVQVSSEGLFIKGSIELFWRI